MNGCYNCRYAEMFSKPREYDGFQVHGVCLKDMGRNGMHNAYPLYIPDAGCKSKIPFGRDSRQVQLDFITEVPQ
ncbi:hypothetical protein ACH6CV_16810 [Bacillota bacterium Meth-B3]